MDIAKAIEYNRRRAPKPFLCQCTWRMIDPTTPAGVEWVARHQGALDDEDWSKEGKPWYDPSKRIAVDGMLGPHTQRALTDRYGPFSTTRHTQHPMPWFIATHRYDQACEPNNLSVDQPDPDWRDFTSHDRWYDAMFRLVSGWDGKTFSRSPKDWISLDEFSIGLAHYWADTAPQFLSDFVTAMPELSQEAWGEKASLMREEAWIRSQVHVLKGKRYHQARYNWLCSGWWYAARQKDAMAWQATEWLKKYGRTAKRTIKHFGWTAHLQKQNGGRILAAVIRMANSGGARGMIRTGIQIVGDDSNPMRVLEASYKAPPTIEQNGERIPWGYGKESRWERIVSWKGFRGPAPTSFRVPAL